jgi:transcription initiation factor IIE alpha subunit
MMMKLLGCSRCTGAIVSASLLAIILSICVAVFTSVILYLLRDTILNINIRRGRRSDHTITTRTSNYEDIRHNCTGRPNSTIDTKKNVAYGQALTVSTILSRE